MRRWTFTRLAFCYYQILALEAPFEGLTVKSFPKLVFEKGARPVPDPKWSVGISALMKRCWSPTIRDRPSMAEVADVLYEDINVNSNEATLDSHKSEPSRRGGKRNNRVGAVTKDVSVLEEHSSGFQC